MQESLDQDISQLCSGILEEAKKKVQDYSDSLESQKEQNKKLIDEQTQSQCLLIKNAFLNVKDGLVEQLFNELKTERS